MQQNYFIGLIGSGCATLQHIWECRNLFKDGCYLLLKLKSFYKMSSLSPWSVAASRDWNEEDVSRYRDVDSFQPPSGFYLSCSCHEVGAGPCRQYKWVSSRSAAFQPVWPVRIMFCGAYQPISAKLTEMSLEAKQRNPDELMSSNDVGPIYTRLHCSRFLTNILVGRAPEKKKIAFKIVARC